MVQGKCAKSCIGTRGHFQAFSKGHLEGPPESSLDDKSSQWTPYSCTLRASLFC